MPYAMIEPIRDLLYSSMQADRTEVDERWVKQLKNQIQDAEVDLVANLGQTPVTLSQIVNLKVGDVISLDIPQAIVADVDGVPMLECKYGVVNGQYALKVNKVLAEERIAASGGKDG